MHFDRHAKFAFIVACLVLLACGLGFRAAVQHLNVVLRKEPVELREHFSVIPRHLGDWRAPRADIQHDAAIIEELGTDLYLDRTYVREEDGVAIAFHLAYYTGMIDGIPHVPDRCMLAGGFHQTALTYNVNLPVDRSRWQVNPELINRRTGQPYPEVSFPHRITGRPITVRMPIGEFGLRITPFVHPRQPETRIHAGFFFIANGRVTHDPKAVRLLAFDRTDRYAYYCKVQFTSLTDMDGEKFVAAVSDLVDELLPEVMRCLPDWPEVEQRDY